MGGLAALTGVVLLASKSSAKSNGSSPGTGTTRPPTTTPPVQTGPLPSAGTPAVPASVLARISGAIASGDPARMRQTAAELRAEGFPQQAADLEAVAEQIEAAQAAGVPAPQVQTPPYVEVPIPTPSGGAATIPIPTGIPASAPGQGTIEVPWPTDVALPTTVPDAAAVQDALAQTLAGRVAANTRTSTKTTYDRDLVAQYQAAEGLEKVDGLYGVRTGLAIAERDIVPAKPFHWGSVAGGAASVERDKTEWRSAMLGYAMADSARNDEWTAAANV